MYCGFDLRKRINHEPIRNPIQPMTTSKSYNHRFLLKNTSISAAMAAITPKVTK